MNLVKRTLAALALLASVSISQAAQYTVSYVDGFNVTQTSVYEITLTSTAPFNFPAFNDVVANSPWWGNAALAQAAAAAVGNSLFVGNQWYNNGLGPSFAWQPFSNSGFQTFVWTAGGVAGTNNEYGVGPFAYGTLVSSNSGGGNASVPEGASTLALIGLAATAAVALRRRVVRA